MMYLIDIVKNIKLSKEEVRNLDIIMRDWPTFQKAAPKMTYDNVLQAFAHEITRPRIRKNIFDKLVGMYNRKNADRNWAECSRFLAERNESEAA